MFQLPVDIINYIYDYDRTFIIVYSHCIYYFKTMLTRNIYQLLDNTSHWTKIDFFPRKIRYIINNKLHMMTIQEIIPEKQYRLVDHNMNSGTYRITLLYRNNTQWAQL